MGLLDANGKEVVVTRTPRLVLRNGRAIVRKRRIASTPLTLNSWQRNLKSQGTTHLSHGGGESPLVIHCLCGEARREALGWGEQ